MPLRYPVLRMMGSACALILATTCYLPAHAHTNSSRPVLQSKPQPVVSQVSANRAQAPGGQLLLLGIIIGLSLLTGRRQSGLH